MIGFRGDPPVSVAKNNDIGLSRPLARQALINCLSKSLSEEITNIIF